MLAAMMPEANTPAALEMLKECGARARTVGQGLTKPATRAGALRPDDQRRPFQVVRERRRDGAEQRRREAASPTRADGDHGRVAVLRSGRDRPPGSVDRLDRLCFGG